MKTSLTCSHLRNTLQHGEVQKFFRICGVTLFFFFIIQIASAQFTQQGSKLVGSGGVGPMGWQGYSCSLSADGNTAIVGGRSDDTSKGAAWVFTRTGNTWSQQGSKLVGTGFVGTSQLGASVVLSADGNTAIVGGPGDNAGAGAAWVFTRTGNTWSQQGSKLVGTGAIGNAFQGYAVALSADGNTAILGGYQDNAGNGTAWIFTRTGSTWSQQGSKLVGSGNTAISGQGVSVALSSDGNTAIVGGYLDNASAGASWIFTRTGSTWSQQGSKLVGTGAVGSAHQGYAVALSSDGNTALAGGYSDNTSAGAVWVFTRTGSTWTQQGSKFSGSGAVGNAWQGVAVGLSSDGNTALVGGYHDNANGGAGWVFSRIGTAWYQQGSKLVGTGNIGSAQQGGSVAISSDGNTVMLGGWYDNAQKGASWVFVRNPYATVTLTNNGLNLPILGNQTTSNVISVPIIDPINTYGYVETGVTASTVQQIVVNVDTLTYPYDADLVISLSHLGIEDTLVNSAGGSGANFINTVLSDSGTNAISGGTAPFSGTFIPALPLSKFNGMDASGSWTLNIYDNATGNSGTLDAWGISIYVPTATTSVNTLPNTLPTGFRLNQNYPNPFNPSTIIKYQLPTANWVTLKVYDILGREVTTLVDRRQDAGHKSVEWSTGNYASGVYFYRLKAGNFMEVKKMMLVK